MASASTPPSPGDPVRRVGAACYWANMTTPGCGDGRFSLSTAYSDDEGASWSKLHVERETPPWVGGMPEIAVDRNVASPNFGAVYVGYNWLGRAPMAPASTSSRRRTSARRGRPPKSPRPLGPRGYGEWWRIGYRLRPAPDGSVYASWYQVDLRRWDRREHLCEGRASERGTPGRRGRPGRFRPGREDTGRRAVPDRGDRPRDRLHDVRPSASGTAGNIRPDPMWLHGFDVDQATGRLYVAVAAYGPATGGAPRGTIQVGRSDDRGETWSFSRLPSAGEAGGRRQSSIRPNLVAGPGYVLVTFHTLDDVQGARRRWAMRSRSPRTVAPAGGSPAAISKARWRAANLGGVINGTGLRERAERLADGDVFWAYGDGRYATGQRPAGSRSSGRSFASNGNIGRPEGHGSALGSGSGRAGRADEELAHPSHVVAQVRRLDDLKVGPRAARTIAGQSNESTFICSRHALASTVSTTPQRPTTRSTSAAAVRIVTTTWYWVGTEASPSLTNAAASPPGTSRGSNR